MNEFENTLETVPPPHYYGDTVRNLFLMAATLLMVSAVIDRGLSAFYFFGGVFMLLGLVTLAGLTSPKRYVSIVADTFFSGVLFVFFEYSALIGNSPALDTTFVLRQLLAILFMLALYFSIKTWRGMR